jgi:phosphoribosylformylglycinamidine synthase
MVGIIDDVAHATTQFFKEAGDAVILLGETKEEIGGTEYLKVVHNQERGMPPDLDLDTEAALHKAVLESIVAGLVKSAHDCADGGLAVALAECTFRGNEDPMGCEVTLDSQIRTDALLFGESQSRVILTTAAADVEKLKAVAAKHGVPFNVIGKTGGGSLVIKANGAVLVDSQVADLKKLWQEAIPKLLSA